MTLHILFLCTHNSARSIMAEKMCQHLASELSVDVQAHSAGSSPSGTVNPVALRVLGAAGVNVSDARSKSWDEFTAVHSTKAVDIVITVCGNAANETCPVWMGAPVQAHWGYADPSILETEEAKTAAFELTRQAVGYKIMRLLSLPLAQYNTAQLQQALEDIAGA